MVLESTDKYKDKRLNLAIITLDLSDIKNEKGELAYLKIFEELEKRYKEYKKSKHELCNI